MNPGDDDKRIPRVFRLERSSDDETVGYGIHWPDGPVMVRWTEPELDMGAWTSLDVFGSTEEIQDGLLTVVWLRQDTYVDPTAVDS